MGVVLVEGKTDEYLVGILLNSLGIVQPTLRGCGGKEEALCSFKHHVNGTEDFVGIIIDADHRNGGGAAKTWEEVYNILLDTDLRFERDRNNDDIPVELRTEGLILNTKPRIGVWIMPNNGKNGETEDFIISLIPSKDKIWKLAENYIDEACKVDRRIKKKSKAKLYAWLAACDPNRQPGAALDTRRLKLNMRCENLRNFESWARKLFGQ